MYQYLLPEQHEGEHLVRLSSGCYILWERDWECECTTESCDCILHGEISGEEAAKLLNPNPHKK